MENEKYKYQGKYIQVSEVSKDGQLWEKVYLCNGIVIYPITDKNEVLLVQEYRPHETPNVRLKPVTGIYEDEYSMEENAQREMQEEIGFKAAKIQKVLYTKSSGTVNNSQYFVIATGLETSKIPNPDGEHTIEKIIAVPIKELYQKLMDGSIPLSGVYLGLLKYLNTTHRDLIFS